MSVLAAVIPAVSGILSDIFSGLSNDNKAKAEQAMKLLDMAAAETAGQLEINKAEAAHRSVFVAGWRPCLGWVCVIAVAFQFLIRPFWAWCAAVYMPGSPMPPSIAEELWPLMFGMLGIGGLRTFEKVKGAAR